MKKSQLKKQKSIKKNSDPLENDISEMIARSELIPASTLFDYLPKDSSINLRLPTHLLTAIRAATGNKNIQKFIRDAVIEKVKKQAS